MVIVVFWRACSHLASVFGHGICASCLSFGMAGWGGRQRQKSDSSQRGSQGLAACTCVDRPATFRDPPQTVGPRRGLNAAIHARGSSTLVAVVLAKYERRRLPPSVLAQHERTLFASRACLLACSGYHSCLLKRMSANPPARSVVKESNGRFEA